MTHVSEYRLTCQVAEYLDTVLDPKWARFTHLPLGEKRNPVTGARLKRMGAKAGWPDLVIVWDYGGQLWLELKTGKGTLSPAQKDFAAFCERNGIPHEVCRTVDQVEAALKKHGVPVRARLT